MVFKKKVKSEEVVVTKTDLPVVKEEVVVSKEDARAEAAPPPAKVAPQGCRLTQAELNVLKETAMVLANYLKISNNVAARVGIKGLLAVLGPMSNESPKE